MRKLKAYLSDNGIGKTLNRIFYRISIMIGLRKSKTYILKVDFQNYQANESNLPKYDVELLVDEFLDQFKKVKYYDFLNADELANSKNSGALLAMDSEMIIGFICFHRDVNHTIHSLGHWNLEKNEVWIGPTYVKKEYRNKKVHKLILSKAIKMFSKDNVKTCYTGINKNNAPSLRSFQNVGFEIAGEVSVRKVFNKIVSISVKNLRDDISIMDKFNV
ncbi:acetyltransferase (GNAT) family protein [Natranaerovirga hydrolytica]|uniref:Acetyltransferase (GNAT) family protein n=1 Tax=Natranaerovirga hydrolytica TaxID=680378 RepID=A0A4R1MM24_9FIRM|nr:GNAT family N-acetyltransferase [Natranaerovirga hydrolytica]TCK93140.1 acetyltransferase (GNAT) family protein [Natranaerovirga hydrolytica]